MLADSVLPHERVLIVAAHPDDETLGASGQMLQGGPVWLAHVTDGAPRSHPDRREYARMRREELLAAAEVAGIRHDHCRTLDFTDQETAFHLVELTRELVRLFSDLNPTVVLTHPYEGGHPDHDSTAFAVQQARRIMIRIGRTPPRLIEFTSYHRNPVSGAMEVARFLPVPGTKPMEVELPSEWQERKRQMISCFASQADMVAQFPVNPEWFRLCPSYDFARPPHAGLLFYEQFWWGVDGAHWRELAACAEGQLAS